MEQIFLVDYHLCLTRVYANLLCQYITITFIKIIIWTIIMAERCLQFCWSITTTLYENFDETKVWQSGSLPPPLFVRLSSECVSILLVLIVM
jgi:hypothetical protein